MQPVAPSMMTTLVMKMTTLCLITHDHSLGPNHTLIHALIATQITRNIQRTLMMGLMVKGHPMMPVM